MGYHFGPEGPAVAQMTLYNFVERAIRLYEQGPGEPCGSARLGEYVQRWVSGDGTLFTFKVDHGREDGVTFIIIHRHQP